ncbi:conserved hypothetical protein [Ricinus communis]|uniref:Uncharacterized protein n=1 Tax=Ricinus communis TaxID=3988 RepID=B9S363_RICCO|nr:conserved hypothetical protein [Ricinus communis]
MRRRRSQHRDDMLEADDDVKGVATAACDVAGLMTTFAEKGMKEEREKKEEKGGKEKRKEEEEKC